MSASSGSVPTAERRTSVAHGPGTSTTPGSWPAFESGSDGRTYMQPKTRKRVWLIGVPLVVVAGTAGFIWGGVYNVAADDMHTKPEIGRALCRERVWQDVKLSVVPVQLKNKNKDNIITSITY